ncbi:oxidative damage protection protein [Arenimonas sp. MALMAid1274]|uniref:oxidative damage protection protein n=1 Tax=Arenimonas sp. MALMAid1274 TaxID=3411630 RepID=UPI003BA387F9
MSRTVFCEKMQHEAEGLAFVPWPGPLGKRVFEHICREAWQQWLAHQTMLINENRLSPMNPEHRVFLEAEMEKFLFAGGAEKPAGYVAPDA